MCFNSMIVRLKGIRRHSLSNSRRSFNSMIVRLKGHGGAESRYARRFQFYDSPIKNCSKNSACTLPSTFQFYDSPIKSHPLVREILARYGFQFYDSPIKNCSKNSACTLPSTFQFYDSPIKRNPRKWSFRWRKQFQFYDSPIKSSSGEVQKEVDFIGFNSMIVRLKVLQEKFRKK